MCSEWYCDGKHATKNSDETLDEALRDILDIAHGWAGPEATASNARRIEVIIQIAEDALFRAHLRDQDRDVSGTSYNRWLATRFDAVALAKSHHHDLTPEQVDLIVGPPFADPICEDNS